MRQCRTVPVALGNGHRRALLAIYGDDFDVDPYVEMFFYPKDTLKMALVTLDGEIVWRRDLGRGVVPGIWFCPVFPFDLDGDGVDEIWYVNNIDPHHPLGLSNYRLERLDALTGETTGQWPWHHVGGMQSLSNTFRNFIVGGHVHGEPVLVTAQGTYAEMYLQGWSPGYKPRWEVTIPKEAPGARGSHMCPVLDINGDGVDELMWGERCLALDSGRELFCGARESYRGHSDVIAPVLDETSGEWRIYTCRESDGHASPRVVVYDAGGDVVWGQVDRGHMDMGWVARLGAGGRKVAMAIRISKKTLGPDGRTHSGLEEFYFDVKTGEPESLPLSTYLTLPVDVNGDAVHELVRPEPQRNEPTYKSVVLDREGRLAAEILGGVSLAGKVLDAPGEQLVTWDPAGTLRIWKDDAAHDAPAALARYANPYYQNSLRLAAVGYNLPLLGGL